MLRARTLGIAGLVLLTTLIQSPIPLMASGEAAPKPMQLEKTPAAFQQFIKTSTRFIGRFHQPIRLNGILAVALIRPQTPSLIFPCRFLSTTPTCVLNSRTMAGRPFAGGFRTIISTRRRAARYVPRAARRMRRLSLLPNFALAQAQAQPPATSGE